MTINLVSRRSFIKGSAAVLGACAVPWSRAQATPAMRLEWQQFKTSVWYTPFLRAIGDMKANTNAADRNSWQFWVDVHRNNCPHDASYFLGWHRGYLYRLEQQLRLVTGMSDFALPYWNYYEYAALPAEFTDATTGNPLYVSGRRGTSVLNALTLAPFASTITNFQRGRTNAFEPTIERGPHNPVHNLIGGVMSTMRSPTDPIFFLHHGNIDRLWVSWVLAGAGRQMPARTSGYWDGSYRYASNFTLRRRYTYDTLTDLGYDYSNRSMPDSIPTAQHTQKGIVRVQATRTAPPLPAVMNAARSPAGRSGPNTFSLGGARGVGLEARSTSVELPVAAAHGAALEALARAGVASVNGSTQRFRSAQIVLDDLQLTPAGAQGGFFYYVYLNLPPSGDYVSDGEQYLVGTIGPFEVEAAQQHSGHHGAPPARHYPITGKLADLVGQNPSRLTVSFVRVDSEQPPSGRVLEIGEVRIELSTDNPPS